MYAELVRKKRCAHCKIEKEFTEYYKRTISPDGRGVYCKICDNIKANEWRSKNTQHIYEQRKAFRTANKERLRFEKLKAKRGLGKEEYENLLKKQGGVCDICGKDPKDHHRTFNLDHDHVTGKNRGILCDNCNRCLGLLKDSVLTVWKCLMYLLKHKN